MFVYRLDLDGMLPVLVEHVAVAKNAAERMDEGSAFAVALTNPVDPSSADTTAVVRATRVVVTRSFVALRTERKAAAALQRSATLFAAFQYPPEETLSCPTR